MVPSFCCTLDLLLLSGLRGHCSLRGFPHGSFCLKKTKTRRTLLLEVLPGSFNFFLSPLPFVCVCKNWIGVVKTSEQEMATHSSVLAWRVLWTEEPGGLLSVGLHRVGHNWSNLACMHALEKEMATHSSVLAWRIPGMEEPGGLPSVGSHSLTRLKRLSSSSSSKDVACFS